jgi:hypothetical protein
VEPRAAERLISAALTDVDSSDLDGPGTGGLYVVLLAALTGGALSRPRNDCQVARRRTSQTVAAMSRTESTSSQPPSMNCISQNRLTGW